MPIASLAIPGRNALLDHPIYRAVSSVSSLRIFMRAHSFAVWDFMSLAKRLQQDICGTTVPWRPPANPRLARFVNEIVLDEETDIGPDGSPGSHFELYLDAMREIGADTGPVERFVRLLADGHAPHRALTLSDAPSCVVPFVLGTLKTAEEGSLVQVAAEFCFGREDVIPDMFRAILETHGLRERAPTFAFYLDRHIELDGGDHGKAAHALVEHALAEHTAQETDGSHADPTMLASSAADAAIARRTAMWDGLLAELSQTAPQIEQGSEPRGHLTSAPAPATSAASDLGDA